MAKRKASKAATRSGPQANPSHHLQARVGEDIRVAIAQFAAERGVSESEIVRDAVVAYLFGTTPGQTMAGPDPGYRIAKSTASVLARQMLHRAWASMPETFEEWLASSKEGEI